MKRFPKKYEVEASRDLIFVEFKEEASLSDEKAIQAELNALKKDTSEIKIINLKLLELIKKDLIKENADKKIKKEIYNCFSLITNKNEELRISCLGFAQQLFF